LSRPLSRSKRHQSVKANGIVGFELNAHQAHQRCSHFRGSKFHGGTKERRSVGLWPKVAYTGSAGAASFGPAPAPAPSAFATGNMACCDWTVSKQCGNQSRWALFASFKWIGARMTMFTVQRS
jgi:hypothetical protein